MGSYNVVLRKSVAQDLKTIPKDQLGALMSRIGELAADPYPDDCERLSAQERYRVRVGEIRIVYEVARGGDVVLIVAIQGTPTAH